MTSEGSDLVKNPTLFLLLILFRVCFDSVYAAVCEYSIVDSNKLYNYSLASATRDFPHGILSEDGFYRVATNDTIVWFQLCDGMIFNHDSPKCIDCWDCGGPSHCGMGCNGLVANNIGGYYICTAIGRDSNFEIHLLDADYPHKGVIVKMASGHATANCSLSVSVICDLDGVKGPQMLQRLGVCDYNFCCEKLLLHGLPKPKPRMHAGLTVVQGTEYLGMESLIRLLYYIILQAVQLLYLFMAEDGVGSVLC